MKTMVFIDFQNFNISMHKFYKSKNGLSEPKITYTKLSKNLVNKITVKNQTLIKTFLFAYKPCKELEKLEYYQKYYSWLNGMKNKPYFEVIEGTQEIRQSHDKAIDIKDTSTYYTTEKGTDVNLAVCMLSKAFTNAYDIAVLVSGDSDYVPVVKELHHLGKIVILATLPNQNISKYNNLCDQYITITDSLLQSCKANQ